MHEEEETDYLDDTSVSQASDLSSTHARWARSWQAAFFTLYCIVMTASLALYVCLLRAMAVAGRRKEHPVNLFLLLLFFTSLVDDALIIEQFVALHHPPALSTSVCRLFLYASYGNRILQPLIVAAMLYYAWAVAELKRTAVETMTRRYFPMAALALLAAEAMITIWPAMNTKATDDGTHCTLIDASFATERLTGWLYLVVFPYIIPALLCAAPSLRLALKLRRDALPDAHATDARVALVTTGGFFFFHVLYYLLMMGREAEALALDRPEWRKLLGYHVWYITRPMFALIAYGWQIVIPLAPFAFDSDFASVFPGNLVGSMSNRMRQQRQKRNNSSMGLSITSVSSVSLNKEAASLEGIPNTLTLDANMNENPEQSSSFV